MKNLEMKTVQDHTRTTDSNINEDLSVNMEELQEKSELSNSVKKNANKGDGIIPPQRHLLESSIPSKKNETPTTQEVTTNKITKFRIILAALILQIIMFLILIAFTSLLLNYYLEMSEEVSELKNREIALLKDGLTDLKNRNDVKEHFLQDIKAINKTIETICGTCPSGWEKIGLFCYYFSTDHLTWDNARDDCIRKGSGLVMLKTREETEALKSILVKARYWIGSYRDKKNAIWKWLDGSAMSFSIWRKGEPNNGFDKEDCLESWDGDWNDRFCTDTEKYVCKKGCCC